jgi:hypothetical protein
LENAINFQFPISGSKQSHCLKRNLCLFLSIPYIGFGVICYVCRSTSHSSFNSLYRVRKRALRSDTKIVRIFQFPISGSNRACT